MFFCKERRSQATRELAHLSFSELAKRVASEWRALTPEQQRVYEQMASRDRQRYLREVELETCPIDANAPDAGGAYPCGRCHRQVIDTDEGIQCEAGCERWFHRTCSGLESFAYELLMREPQAQWCCDACDAVSPAGARSARPRIITDRWLRQLRGAQADATTAAAE